MFQNCDHHLTDRIDQSRLSHDEYPIKPIEQNMKYTISASLTVVLLLLKPEVSFGFQAPQVPDGYGQMEHAPVVFRAGLVEQGREYFLNGQRAGDG